LKRLSTSTTGYLCVQRRDVVVTHEEREREK